MAKSKPVKGQWRGSKSNINRDGGPPKTHWWSVLLEEKAKAQHQVKKMEKREVMAEALIDKAMSGDIAAIKEFADRVQGKAKESVDMNLHGSVSLVSATMQADDGRGTDS